MIKIVKMAMVPCCLIPLIPIFFSWLVMGAEYKDHVDLPDLAKLYLYSTGVDNIVSVGSLEDALIRLEESSFSILDFFLFSKEAGSALTEVLNSFREYSLDGELPPYIFILENDLQQNIYILGGIMAALVVSSILGIVGIILKKNILNYPLPIISALSLWICHNFVYRTIDLFSIYDVQGGGSGWTPFLVSIPTYVALVVSLLPCVPWEFFLGEE